MKRTRRRVLRETMAGGATLMATGAAGAQTTATRTPDQTPQQFMTNLLSGYRLTQMVHVAARLGIADKLRNGPLSLQQLATATNSHADSLYRLLRTLAGLGIFAEEDNRKFRLTPAAELLLSGVPGSLPKPACPSTVTERQAPLALC